MILAYSHHTQYRYKSLDCTVKKNIGTFFHVFSVNAHIQVKLFSILTKCINIRNGQNLIVESKYEGYTIFLFTII